MQGTSIRNIRKNKSEMIIRQRLNTNSTNHPKSKKKSANFFSEKQLLKTGSEALFKVSEFLKHASNRKSLIENNEN